MHPPSSNHWSYVLVYQWVFYDEVYEDVRAVRTSAAIIAAEWICWKSRKEKGAKTNKSEFVLAERRLYEYNVVLLV